MQSGHLITRTREPAEYPSCLCHGHLFKHLHRRAASAALAAHLAAPKDVRAERREKKKWPRTRGNEKPSALTMAAGEGKFKLMMTPLWRRWWFCYNIGAKI